MTNRENELQVESEMEDLKTVLLNENEANVTIGTSSVIGQRPQQQDAIRTDTKDSYLETGKIILVLCDGMGGLTSGEKASALCSSIVYDAFHSEVEFPSIPVFYEAVIPLADAEVRKMKTEDGAPIKNAGTTLVSVVVEDGNLYWASVGDSRIYLIRNHEILCITKDHNLRMLLEEKVKRGVITQEEVENNPKKEALISYIGMGGVSYVDMNNKPFPLLDGDYLVLCSDGLYRSVSEQEIKRTVCKFGTETQFAAEALTELAIGKKLKNQDNTSVVVIHYQDSG